MSGPSGRPVDGVLGRARGLATHPWLPLAVAWFLLIALGTRHDPMVALLAVLGFGGAFVSSLVGIGGGIVIIPLLLFAPPLLGLPELGIKTVSGIAVAQVASAAVAGALGHLHHGQVDRTLLVLLGASMTATSLVAALVSAAIPADVVTAVFATMALAGAALLLWLRAPATAETLRPLGGRDRVVAVSGGGLIGILVGIVGSGNFFLVPLMLYVLRVPMRIAAGTSLSIIAFAGLAGLAGKALTGQVDWLLALGLVVAALPGGRLGSSISRRVRVDRLAVLLGSLVGLVAIRLWIDLLT